MVTISVIFWICFFLVIYTYIGYGIVLYILLSIKRLFGSPLSFDKNADLPGVTFVVAAYNEENWIEKKILNGLQFDYPLDKIHYLFVTDGSNDSTPDRIKYYNYPEGVSWSLHHKDERRGKIAAVERIMEFIDTPITIFTDANTDVNPQAIKNIVRHYQNPKVGAVAGEKRIMMGDKDAANAAGEGFYWKYESTLKKWDSELYSVVGAAGELFSLRTELYQPVEEDTLIEDFVMTMRIAGRGFKVRYEPNAYAVESSSASVEEELKRKIRIAAGGIQASVRLRALYNIFKHGILTFQLVSHRILRWTITPIAMVLLFFTNIYLALNTDNWIYDFFMIGQILFYLLSFIGYLLRNRPTKIKIFFIPYYFCVMNYAVFRGFFRYIKGNQSVVWEKAKRADG